MNIIFSTEDVINYLIVNRIEIEMVYVDDTTPSVKGFLTHDDFYSGTIHTLDGKIVIINWKHVSHLTPNYGDSPLYELVGLTERS